MRIIKNVRLETGNGQHDDGTLKTLTDIFNIFINKEGNIEKIEKAQVEINDDELDVFDANGKLAVPAFKEMHNHLDKTYLSLEWRATRPVKNRAEQLQMEIDELEKLKETMPQRARAMIDKLISTGVNHIRTHVNVDPFEGVEAVKIIKSVLEEYKDKITYEIVAFPQFGMMIFDEGPDLLRKALENGADILGGLDPAGRDNNIEEYLQIIMDIAKEYDVPVDIHLHDPDELGYYTLDKWIDMMEEQGFENEVSFDHLYGLGSINEELQEKIVKRMADNNIRLMSAIPFSVNGSLPPIDKMVNSGIKVSFGCDGFYDSWTPYVYGDILEKVRNFCEFTGKTRELDLRNSLKHITNGIIPLSDNGDQLWPKQGDPVDLVLVESSCSAEMVARPPQERILISKGQILN